MKKLRLFLIRVLYNIILLLVKSIPVRVGKKHLLIIKTDEIGDYILFRNLLSHIRKSEKFREYKITLVGNIVWKDLYLLYDSICLDNVVWLNKTKFKKQLRYRFSALVQIRKLSTSDVLNAVFSRSLNLDDGIAFIAKGTDKVAMEGDETNRSGKTDFDRLIYTKIIHAGNEQVFDAVRNADFISSVLGQPIPFDTKVAVKHVATLPDEPYFVISTGAGNKERQWPITYFAETAHYIQRKYNLVPVLCGGPADIDDAKAFSVLYGDMVYDYTGKTSLPQLLDILSRARFLLCVDTGTLHMAAAAGCPVVGLYSGKFYKRFAPYPVEITDKFYPVYPDFADRLIKNNDPILYDTSVMRNDTIRQIPVEKVLPFIDRVMI